MRDERPARTVRFTSQSPRDTAALGKALGACLQPGDIVLLSGDLGAGKTQLVQGVAAGLGASETPLSPTFNIVLTYGSGRMPLHHFDLYRLDEPSQLEDIGMREYLDSDGACFVEWADKFPQYFPEHLRIDIAKGAGHARELVVSAVGPRHLALMDNWEAETNMPARESSRRSSSAGNADTEDGPAAIGALPHFSNIAESCKIVSRDAGAAMGRYVLAFDTANEVVAVGIGKIDPETRSITIAATLEVKAHRASNTRLLPLVDGLMEEHGIDRGQIACICAGRGPGSFTGVRIAMATAKGIAQALGVGLVGVSTLDAIARNAQADGVRGRVTVVADAMRKEVYPVSYDLGEETARRLTADRVVKADLFAAELADASRAEYTALMGDALVKYGDLLGPYGTVLPDRLWTATGRGLLLVLQDAWRSGSADPLDAVRHDPGLSLPVYTRLSDAEENERARLARSEPKNLVSGVQDVAPDGGKGRATMHATAILASPPDDGGISYRPLDASRAPDVAGLEHVAMGSDAWNAALVADELGRRDRTWWIAEHDGALVGYAGGMVVDGDMQILKVAVGPSWRRRGIARELVTRIADDARNLGASTCSLEVRTSNDGARAFYESLGLHAIGTRPRYYSDREDAVIMQGPLPAPTHDIAGMELQRLETASRAASADGCPHTIEQSRKSPLILAIESSCDETAGAVVDGSGALLSDVVASQIDFHARFGGVVPEIASRKHIEAICGVCAEALEVAGTSWRDLDAIAVTYAPGLVGALVVGVAFAKGAAWALGVPFIGVNHLEGHLYANKIGQPEFAPPAVVSLVSGGNTMLVHMRGWGDYETLGTTIDDAVGEAFDKVAKALGLGYPGGPAISKLAAEGDPAAIDFPRAMMHSHDLRFSLSGLKTAVVNYVNGERQAGRALDMPDVAASFQQAVVDVQVAKAKTALEQTGARTFCLGGGVAANPTLRAAYEDLCADMGVQLVMPPLSSCGDNAGMIALVALDRFREGLFFDLSADAYAHANLDDPY